MAKNNIKKNFLSTIEIKTFRMIYRATFLTLGFIAIYVMSVLLEEGKYGIAILPAGFALIFTLLEFVFGEMIVEKSYPSDTRKIMKAVVEMPDNVSESLINSLNEIINGLNGCDKLLVQATIHLKINLSTDKSQKNNIFGLLQIFPYYHIGLSHQEFISSNEKRGRVLEGFKGIIGRCIRTEDIEYVNFATREEYDVRMVNEFGFSKHEIEKHTFSARSYYAAPFKSTEGDMTGIIYLFTKEPQVFPKAVNVNTFISEANHIGNILKVGKILKPKANILYKK